MAILGVLLGITLSALVALYLITKKHNEDHHSIAIHTLEQVKDLRERIAKLEARKAYAAEAEKLAESLPKKAGRASVRTWNEDIGAAE